MNIFLGAIFYKGDEDLEFIFEEAISATRYENSAPAFRLIPKIKKIDDNIDSFKTAIVSKYAIKSIIKTIIHNVDKFVF